MEERPGIFTTARVRSGEIWFWPNGGIPFIQALTHGGHSWDRAWAEANGIGNVDALEAVPEPASMILFGLACVSAAVVRRRRKLEK